MIYLDNCATTKVNEKVVKAVNETFVDNYGNPSSLHHFGMDAFQFVANARAQVANLIGAPTSSIIFTNGGTFSNNIALFGVAYANKERGRRIITTAIEHSSVLAPLKRLEEKGFEVIYVKPDPISKEIKAEDVLSYVNEDTILVSLMHVNNETGEILPVEKVCEEIKKHHPSVLVHSDCVQSYGKIPIELYKLKVDLLTASAHKIGSLKGTGMLYVKEGVKLQPLFYGGPQEKGYTPGTENVPGIVGFGMASEICMKTMKERLHHVTHLKSFLLDNIKELPDIHINSKENYLPYVVSISLLGHDSHDMVAYLGNRDIYVSAGSACNKDQRSHVLKACGYSPDIINSVLRISFSYENTEEDVITLFKTLKEYIQGKEDRQCLLKTRKN